MKDFEKFIDGFRNFRRFYFDAENDYYTSLNKGQHPKAIVIACSDSRADPALLMGCDPGDIFVVRNVANLVPHADDALRRDAVLAVLEYGVHHLKVEHIIVLGHSGCGGIQALLNPESLHDESFVANWVSMAAPALERMREDVRDESPADRQRHCEEAAILVSIDNLLSYPWIQERVAATSCRCTPGISTCRRAPCWPISRTARPSSPWWPTAASAGPWTPPVAAMHMASRPRTGPAPVLPIR